MVWFDQHMKQKQRSRKIPEFFSNNPGIKNKGKSRPEKSRDPGIWQNPVPKIPGLKILIPLGPAYSRQMGEFAEDILVDVKKAVDQFCDASAAITTDLWTSRARHSYISITLHFIDELFRLHRFTLGCLKFKKEQTRFALWKIQMLWKRESLVLEVDNLRWESWERALTLLMWLWHVRMNRRF